MPNVTTNYGLKKPLPEEFYDIAVLNENMDIIDAELKRLGTATGTDDANIQLLEGGNKVIFSRYHSNTLNTPHTEGLTIFAAGLIITFAHTNTYGSQICIPAGSSEIFTRASNITNGVTKWVKYATIDAVRQLIGVAPATVE